MLARSRVIALSFFTLSLFTFSLGGCAKRHVETSAETSAAEAASAPPAAEPAPGSPSSTIVEESDLGTITWRITQEGHVEAVVKRPDGAAVTKEMTGALTWPSDAADDEREMTLDAEGRLVADGPPLAADLVEIDYALVIEGKPWNGVLHVPRGGTQAIDADARADAAANIDPGKKGPNGGVIQRIGGDLVEVVADSTTGEMRVYLLGPSYEVIDPGERRIRLGYVADYAETLEMEREPGGLFFVTRVRTRLDPLRVTLAVGLGAAVHVGIVGFHAGARLGCGGRARAIPLMVERRWTPSVAVRVGVGARADGRVRVDERVRVRVNERVDVKVHGHGRDDDHHAGHGDRGHHGGGQVKVHVKDHGGHDHGGRGGPSHGGGRGKKR